MLLFLIIIGYIIGSISWGLIIGKVFFKIDIREHGSGNSGGTNAGRVLGKYWGYIVIVLDAIKAIISVYIGSFYSPSAAILAGLACAIGHCYPIFSQLRGGKAVACTYGYLIGLGLFVVGDLWLFVITGLSFLLILFVFRMVSLASILSSLISIIVSLFQSNIQITISLMVLSGLIIYRHRANIERIKNKTESKVRIFGK